MPINKAIQSLNEAKASGSIDDDTYAEALANLGQIGSKVVPADDLPEAGPEEVPVNDLPEFYYADYDINPQGLEQGTTVSDIQKGRQVEPNEALEPSVLDPLTNIGLGAIPVALKGARGSAILKNNNKRATQVKDKIDNFQKTAGQKEGMRIDNTPPKPLHLRAAEYVTGKISPEIKAALDKAWETVAAPFSSKAAYNKAMREIPNIMEELGVDAEEAARIWVRRLMGKAYYKPFMPKNKPYSRIFNDPAVKEAFKGSAINALLQSSKDDNTSAGR